MALGNLIIKKKRQIGGIAIDGFVSETTTRSSTMTSNPVENGLNVSEHIITQPLEYILEGVITDTPFAIAGVSGVADSESGIVGKSDDSEETRSQEIYYQLVDLMNNKELLEVHTSLKTYDDLVMETISVIQNKDRSRSIWFTATFKQALLVRTATIEIDSENILGDANKANKGAETEQGSVPIAEATQEETSLIRVSFNN